MQYRAWFITSLISPIVVWAVNQGPIPDGILSSYNPSLVADSSPSLTPEQFGAKGDGTDDDSAAIASACAAAAGRTLVLSRSYKMYVDKTLNCNWAFWGNGNISPDSGVTVTHNGNTAAYDTAYIYNGIGSVIESTTSRVSVSWWGAQVPGTDAAVAIRAALGSNRTILIPPGTYTMKSQSRAPCCALDPANVLVQGLSNFEILGYGAVLTTDNSNNFTSWLHVDTSHHWSLKGITCLGNRTGLSPVQENACFTLTSDSYFTVRDINATGNWGGESTISAGDWLSYGLIDNVKGNAVGQCFDYGFVQDLTISNVFAVGADANGRQGATQVGWKCLSITYDPPNASQNRSAVAFPDPSITSHLTVTGFDASNFRQGWMVNSGNYFLFSGNKWHDNPGLVSKGESGIGGYLVYIPGASTGYPPGNIAVNGDVYANNGMTQPGAGILLGAGTISNGDIIKNVIITNSIFDNNASFGIETDAAVSKFANVVVESNVFSGGAQVAPVGPHLYTVLAGCGKSPGGRWDHC
jgi:hypothetical protein